MSRKFKSVTCQLDVTAEEARALFHAIEHAAHYEKGAGRQDQSDLLWGIFDRLEKMHFYKIAEGLGFVAQPGSAED